MSVPVLNIRFTPVSSTELSAGLYRVQGPVFDGNGQFTGFDVMTGDAVFLDTLGSSSAPGTISRYVVSNIVSLGASAVTIDIEYSDTGTAVDPAEVVGLAGFISRQNAQQLTFHTAPTVQSIPDYIVQYARSYDNYVRMSSLFSSTDASALVSPFTNATGTSIPIGTPVYSNTSGNIDLANASSEIIVKSFTGITASSIPDSSAGSVVLSGLIKNISTSVSVGNTVYLGKTGGIIGIVPDIGVDGFIAGDFVFVIGKITKNAINPANKDLLVAPQLVGQL